MEIGKSKFSVREITVIAGIVASMAAYMVRVEVGFALAREGRERCEERLRSLEQYTGFNDTKPAYRCGPPCDTGKEKPK